MRRLGPNFLKNFRHFGVKTFLTLESCESDSSSLPPASEFTQMLTRGKLKHPPADLYDLSKYMYSFFKMRAPKCCNKLFIESFRIIYEHSGCEYEGSESIIRRFVNCFFSALAKDQTDKIKQDKEAANERKKRKCILVVCGLQKEPCAMGDPNYAMYGCAHFKNHLLDVLRVIEYVVLYNEDNDNFHNGIYSSLQFVATFCNKFSDAGQRCHFTFYYLYFR